VKRNEWVPKDHSGAAIIYLLLGMAHEFVIQEIRLAVGPGIENAVMARPYPIALHYLSRPELLLFNCIFGLKH
jgi:hypothetical protein